MNPPPASGKRPRIPPLAARNLDREPGFLLTVVMILPAMAAVEIALLVERAMAKVRRG